MQLVRQKEQMMAHGAHRSRRTLGAALAVAALASAATACSGGAEPPRGAPAPAAGQQAPAAGGARYAEVE
ncbi:hypothetical protein [Streptomyces sp. NPDC004285]